MKILLATLHAKYVHASLALPCLASACRNIPGSKLVIHEFTVNEQQGQVLRKMVAENADVVAFSCYIWNIEQTLKLADSLKKLQPAVRIVLGGPETAEAEELLAANPAIDAVIRGEGEQTFLELMARWSVASSSDLSDISGLTHRSGGTIASTPERTPIIDLDTVSSPFAAGLVDLSKPLVYYETSRGCPFSCAYCMSSLEKGVRSFSMERIKLDLQTLMEHGVQTIKLVDRTFNYDAHRANAIWEYILSHNSESKFHFEIAADLLTDENVRVLQRVQVDRFRFEIGVQSAQSGTLEKVARKSDLERLFQNVRRLRQETQVMLHLDLVAGLPGEDYAGFLHSLQQLFDILSSDAQNDEGGFETCPYKTLSRDANGRGGSQTRPGSTHPCHIQIEPLKVLKGSPMQDIARSEGYAWSSAPPYTILRTPWLSFEEIGRIEIVARLIDLYYNSGRFTTTFMEISGTMPLAQFFSRFALHHEKHEEQPSSLEQLFTTLWRFCNEELPEASIERIRDALRYDFCLVGYPSRLPTFFGEGGRPVPLRELQIIPKPDAKVRTFSAVFNYNHSAGTEGPVQLVFVYTASPGEGLRVDVVWQFNADQI